MTPATSAERGFEAGARLGKYEILERIGHGSLGSVYRALDTVLGREVALKVLQPQLAIDAEIKGRFLDEARLTARLDEHTGIISIYDSGEVGGYLYLAMRLHDGHSLARLLEAKGHLSLTQTVQIVAQVADALDFAHRSGIIHRDVKPGNIMVDSDGQASLTDFGLAKAMSQTAGKTIVGTVMGTPNYMSPEQVKGETVGPSSDSYSLAITTYQMLTGELPYDADSMAAILYKQAHSDLPRVELKDRPRCSARVDAVLRRALHKDPKRRWPSARAFAAALADAEERCDRAPSLAGLGRQLLLVASGVLLVAGVLAAARLTGGEGAPGVDESGPSDATPVEGRAVSGADAEQAGASPPTDTAVVVSGRSRGTPGSLDMAASDASNAQRSRPTGSSTLRLPGPLVLGTRTASPSAEAVATRVLTPQNTEARPSRTPTMTVTLTATVVPRTARPTTTSTRTPSPVPPTPEPPTDEPRPTDPPEPPREPPTNEPPEPPQPPLPPADEVAGSWLHSRYLHEPGPNLALRSIMMCREDYRVGWCWIPRRTRIDALNEGLLKVVRGAVIHLNGCTWSRNNAIG